MWRVSTMVERSVASKWRFYFRRRRLPRAWKHLRFVACLEMIVKVCVDRWCARILTTQTQLVRQDDPDVGGGSYWLQRMKHLRLTRQCENFKVDLEETKWKQCGSSQLCNSLNNNKIDLKKTSRLKAQPCKCNTSWPGWVLRPAPAQRWDEFRHDAWHFTCCDPCWWMCGVAASVRGSPLRRHGALPSSGAAAIFQTLIFIPCVKPSV